MLQTSICTSTHCHDLCIITMTGGCDPPPDIPYTQVSGNHKEQYAEGDTVIYNCTVGIGSQTRMCLSDGSWSGHDFMCGGM